VCVCVCVCGSEVRRRCCARRRRANRLLAAQVPLRARGSGSHRMPLQLMCPRLNTFVRDAVEHAGAKRVAAYLQYRRGRGWSTKIMSVMRCIRTSWSSMKMSLSTAGGVGCGSGTDTRLSSALGVSQVRNLSLYRRGRRLRRGRRRAGWRLPWQGARRSFGGARRRCRHAEPPSFGKRNGSRTCLVRILGAPVLTLDATV